MPFTPFHIGHILPVSLWDWEKKRIDITAAIIGSMIIDIEPVLILIFNLNYPLHYIFHSFPLAIFVGIVTGILIHFSFPIFNPFLKFFKWEQQTSIWNKIFIATIMTDLHVLLDAFLYPEMNPFFFIKVNPFYGLVSARFIYCICEIGIAIGIGLYGLYFLYSNNRKTE